MAYGFVGVDGWVYGSSEGLGFGDGVDGWAYSGVDGVLIRWRMRSTETEMRKLITTESKLLEDEGKEIVRKCGCLPLAISVIGGILRGKKTSSEWEKVKKNIDLYLKQGEGVGKDTRILQILDLSYNVLPYNLKPCFLYLGCFQEDKDIEAEQLYLLWMAEGMISSENKGRGETLRDVAERYLYELANRCMVQVKVEDDEYSIYDRSVSCRLHDLMRDLCLSKGKQEEFVEVVDTHRPIDIGSLLGRTHRLAIHNKENWEDLQFVYERRNQNLRSLLLLHFQYTGIFTISCIDFGMFTSLKILMLEGCEFKNDKLPDGIEKLILLKHLSLYESKVDEVPPSIRKLPCLQSLDVRTNCQLKLPSVINSTGRLRHLFLPAEITCIERGGKLKLDGLNELETLSWFNSQSVDFSHIHKLVNLRELNGYICDEESLSRIVLYISDHQYQLRKTIFGISSSCTMNSEQGGSIDLLRKMLMCHSLVKLCMSCHVRKLPAYEPQLCRNLIYLTLDDCRMEEDPMQTLEKFPMLRTLQLVKNAFVGREMVCRAAGFPQLRHLYIISLRSLVEWRVEESAMPNLSTLKLNDLFNLVEWRVEERAMPNLSSLHIVRCKKLKMIPEGLRFITTLQKMTIRWMPQKFVDRIRIVDGEDYDKIKHIPSINF
ncbi:hypothetical protein BUALT_Bualt14G0040600 [Buddleja alternifolia]|uniref:NB-ARC domain-containing protein n=1 Tax=Buddleja alternifolia TaxID=168488 RepID=A0AAV6WPC8_9LAMI|nr:hypothetical protein BUALT_Bualt14G0040600 [Buddleja alternifolia]